MSDDERATTALVAKSLLAGGLAVASLASPASAPLVIAAAILPDVAAFMTQRVLKSRLEKFFGRFTRDDAAFEDIEARIQADLLTDPYLAQTIWSAVRAVLDVLDDSVVPTLGALAVEYRQQKKAADSFFRGMTSLLAGLSAEEFITLKSLVTACNRFDKSDDPLTVWADLKTTTLKVANSNVSWDPVGPHTPLIETIFRQLKAHGIGAEPDSGGFGASNGPTMLSIRRETVLRLFRMLGD